MNAAVAQSKPILPGLLSLLLVAVLGISLAKLMWLVLTPEQKITTQVQQINPTQNTRKQKTNYGKLIANQHLFGLVKKKPVKAQPKTIKKTAPVVKAPPPVKLNLKLHGIVAYKTSKKNGFALISLDNGPQQVFAKGQELKEGKGVYVVEILPEKVVLDNNGQREELTLPRKDSKKTNTPQHPAQRLRFGGARIPPPRPVNNRQKKQPVNLSEFRQQVKANPRKLLDIASTSPAVVNGEFVGFRIQPGRNAQLFRQLGFRPNDIITEVNGIVLDDISKGAIVLGELSEASEVSIKIKRGNQELFIQRSF